MVNDAFSKVIETQRRCFRVKNLTLIGTYSHHFEELVRTICSTLKVSELTLGLDLKQSKAGGALTQMGEQW